MSHATGIPTMHPRVTYATLRTPTSAPLIFECCTKPDAIMRAVMVGSYATAVFYRRYFAELIIRCWIRC